MVPLPEIPYDDWFDNNSKYNPDVGEYLPENDDEPPRPEEEIADNITLHEKMYRIATDKYNPFSIGGSENVHDFDRKD
jgi:hypothetical protein